ncbi:hypothetical protein [Paenarthrobacter sp. NPDC058040]|uniref:hypothetical protein n=1 Tax=Paenarthrobacter sp. NPDC058040 TaxID=3346309 RepID=UPI0036D77C06
MGSIAAIVWVSIVVQGETLSPLANQPPAQGQEGPAAWLSAWSTFAGAVATTVGALLTGGALLIAALTYRRQVADKHREAKDKREEQAGKIIVRVVRRMNGQSLVDLKNPTSLPIFKLNLYAIDEDGKVIDAQPLSKEVVVGDYEGHLFDDWCRVQSAYAEFTDSGGVAWIRTSKGTLVEKGKEPEDFDPREMWQPGDLMHTWETWYGPAGK